MNKLPVGEATRFAYAFTIRELGTIIGLIWIPMVALAIISFLPYALGDNMPSPDINPTAAGAISDRRSRTTWLPPAGTVNRYCAATFVPLFSCRTSTLSRCGVAAGS